MRHVGLSEVSAADIRRAHAVVPITTIEQEWSLFSRDIEASCFYVILCDVMHTWVVPITAFEQEWLVVSRETEATYGGLM